MNNELTNYSNGLLDPFFDFFAPVYKESKYRGLQMRTDIKEDEKGYTFDIDLPGVKKENISVSFKDGYLKIEVQSQSEEKENETSKYIRRERYFENVSRSFYIGEVDEKNITAKFDNGVLNLFAPKAVPEEAKETKIAIL